MGFLQKFLAVLMLFLTAAHGWLSRSQLQDGRVKGFTGPADVDQVYVSLLSSGWIDGHGYTVLTSKSS